MFCDSVFTGRSLSLPLNSIWSNLTHCLSAWGNFRKISIQVLAVKAYWLPMNKPPLHPHMHAHSLCSRPRRVHYLEGLNPSVFHYGECQVITRRWIGFTNIQSHYQYPQGHVVRAEFLNKYLSIKNRQTECSKKLSSESLFHFLPFVIQAVVLIIIIIIIIIIWTQQKFFMP